MKTKKVISTDKAPTAIGPYSQAIEHNGILYISGQIPLNPSTGKVIDGDITAQTEQVFSNISAILAEADYQFTDVVKTTVFIADMSLFAAVNEVYKKYYQINCPARSTVAVKGLPLGVLVEIETIAMK